MASRNLCQRSQSCLPLLRPPLLPLPLLPPRPPPRPRRLLEWPLPRRILNLPAGRRRRSNQLPYNQVYAGRRRGHNRRLLLRSAGRLQGHSQPHQLPLAAEHNQRLREQARRDLPGG